jgi:hypothetical protein
MTSIGCYLKQLETLHGDAAKARVDIVAARDRAVECLFLALAQVRGRSDELLAQLDDIELRRTVDIETAMAAVDESVAVSVPVDPSSFISFIMAKSRDQELDVRVRTLKLGLFEFRDAPVLHGISVLSWNNNILTLAVPPYEHWDWDDQECFMNVVSSKLTFRCVPPLQRDLRYTKRILAGTWNVAVDFGAPFPIGTEIHAIYDRRPLLENGSSILVRIRR